MKFGHISLFHFYFSVNIMNISVIVQINKAKANDRILKEGLPRSVGAQYATGDQGEITPERMKGWSQSKNNTQLWM